jgi:hypothetical protein
MLSRKLHRGQIEQEIETGDVQSQVGQRIGQANDQNCRCLVIG